MLHQINFTMNFSHTHLDWEIRIFCSANGWRFEAAPPESEETLTNHQDYPHLENALFAAIRLVDGYTARSKIGEKLSDLRDRDQITQQQYSDILEQITALTHVAVQP